MTQQAFLSWASTLDPSLVRISSSTTSREAASSGAGLCEFQIDCQRRTKDPLACRRARATDARTTRRGPNLITAPLEPPLGRGINFQISIESLEPILTALDDAGHPLFMAPEERWYRITDDREEADVRQFLVMDPDGYFFRFQASLGRRQAPASGESS